MRRVTKGNSYGVRLSPKDEQMVLNYINEEQMTFMNSQENAYESNWQS